MAFFLFAGKVSNFASTIQMTRVFICLHGAENHRSLQEFFLIQRRVRRRKDIFLILGFGDLFF